MKLSALLQPAQIIELPGTLSVDLQAFAQAVAAHKHAEQLHAMGRIAIAYAFSL